MANISIKLIKDKDIWEEFAQKQSPTTFMQSWNWGQFHKSLGRKVWYLGIYEGDELIGVCLCHPILTKMRSHLYTSNGPLIDWGRAGDIIPVLLEKLKEIAAKEGVIFIRMDPLILDTKENNEMLRKFGMQRAATNSQAECKWILDITPEEDELLMNMKKNTRYAIRRSAKEGVKVESSFDFKDFEKFWGLYLKTVEKQKFVPHSKEYYVKQIQAFAEDRQYRIYWAHLRDKVLAAGLIPFYGDTAFYLHASSSDEVKNAFPNHALIWKIIQDAKAEGLSYFDFWGIAPTDDPKHPWAGFSFFKKSFGGFRQDMIRGYDKPLSMKYSVVRGLESTRRLWVRRYYDVKKKFGR